MGNNKFCTSCKYFEKSPDNCGRKNGKYGLCVRQMEFNLKPMVVNYQHSVCEEFKDKIEAVKRHMTKRTQKTGMNTAPK